MSSKDNEIDFSTDIIASRDAIKGKELEFLNEAKHYLTDHNLKNFQKVRFLHLLRITDILISDDGVINQQNIGELTKIAAMVDKKFKKKILSLLNELKIIDDIRKQNFNQPLTDNQLVSFINIENVQVKDDISSEKSLETDILEISAALLILLKRNKANIFKLNKCSNERLKLNNPVVRYMNFTESIMLWKYAHASLKKDLNGEYIIDAYNEIEFDFIKTRDDLQNNRLKQYKLNEALSNNDFEIKKYAILYGIAQLWNIDLKPIQQKQLNINKLLKLKGVKLLLQQDVYGTPLENWIIFFEKLRNYFNEAIKNNLSHSRFFYKISTSWLMKVTGLPKKDINLILQNCLMSEKHDNDLYDSPIIFTNNEYYTYIPLWKDFDSIYTISNIMRRCKNHLKNFASIGHNLESEIYNMLMDRGFEVEKNVKYKGQEIDVLTKDSQNKNSVFIECKTFTPPANIKDYIIQLEKIFVNNHITKARKNFDCLRENPKVKDFIKDTNVREVYLPSIIVPNQYTKYLNKANILYIQYFTFTKLLTTPSERLNDEFNIAYVWGYTKNGLGPLPIPVAKLDEDSKVTLNSKNLLGKNLDILNKKQPKLKIYHDTSKCIKTKFPQRKEYRCTFFIAYELDCNFIKIRAFE